MPSHRYSAQALPAGFLISNPNNTLRNNVAAGSTAGAGIWYQVRAEGKTHAELKAMLASQLVENNPRSSRSAPLAPC